MSNALQKIYLIVGNLRPSCYKQVGIAPTQNNDNPLKAPTTYSYLPPSTAIIFVVTRHLVYSPFPIVCLGWLL